MNDKLKLLDVKLTSKVDEDNVVIVTSLKNEQTGETCSRSFSQKSPVYKDMFDLIKSFQNGDISEDEFKDKLVDKIMSQDVTGVANRIAKSKAVSSHVFIRNNHVYVDDVLINPTLENQVLEIMRSDDKEAKKSWMSLIHFVEKLYTNTSEYVRNQLYGWIKYQVNNGKLTLMPNGDFIAYKGCELKVDDGKTVVTSINAGHGFVNGKEYHNSQLPNEEGYIVEIPRDEVDPDPATACSTGLHVGTWDYASSFAEGATMLVEVDPINVVSVPEDYNNQKVRVCKYKVLKITKKPLNEIVFSQDDNDSDKVYADFDEVPTADDVKEIDYTTLDGEPRVYKNVKDIKDEDSTILIITEDDEYRRLSKANVSYKLNNTDSDDDDDSDDEVDKIISQIPRDCDVIVYHKLNSKVDTYFLPKIVNITKGKKTQNNPTGIIITIQFHAEAKDHDGTFSTFPKVDVSEDLQYRSLPYSMIEFEFNTDTED